ncbi:MAG: hypothetical protein NC115_02710 [Bacteroidales bacterium]|nr:hypothetical protein [Bacteroides sp.]MCM1198219.1 hypothetical protein [Clostridium sp.]MCM1501565.1 hypothetical protein [Bacteroidales bacterium]
MKKIAVLFLCVMALVAAGCSQKDPIEKLGSLPEDRLTPQDVQNVLCSVDMWKLDYAGHSFYFSFKDDGDLYSSSDIEKMGITATYGLGWSDFHSVQLDLGRGHFNYIDESVRETSFVVEDGHYSAEMIVATGVNIDEEFVFVPATESERTAIAQKDQTLAESYAEIMQSVSRIRNAGLCAGAIFSGNSFIAHWAILEMTDDGDGSIRIDELKDRVLTHRTVQLTVLPGNALKLIEPVVINGVSVTDITMNTSARTASFQDALSGTSSNGVGDWFATGDYKTFLLRPDSSRGDANDAMWQFLTEATSVKYSQVEISDRGGRPFVFCPRDHDGYAGFFYTLKVSSEFQDLVNYSTTYSPSWVFQENDSSWFDDCYRTFKTFLDFFTASEGVIYVKGPNVPDSGSKIWILSPVDETWIMADRDA